MTPEDFRAALKRLGLTQTGAAVRMDISSRQVNRYALGSAEIPKVVQLALRGLEAEGIR